MNLVTEYLENSFEIKSKTINTLVIEDTKYFTKFIKALMETANRGSEEFGLIEDFKKVDLSKVTEIIFDLFSLEANNANILKKLYEELEKDINSEEIFNKKIEMESLAANIADDLIHMSRFSLKSGDINYQNFFKAIAIEFDYDKNSIIEKLIEYIKVTADLLDKKLFVIINLDSFLTEEDLVELSKFLCYNKIKVLALQNKITRQVKTCENLRILDQDLCEI